jgi:Flp pilus assembly pilin Flp
MNALRRFVFSQGIVRDERGLSTVEYTIILALIAAFSVGTWQTFGSKVKDYIGTSSDTIEGNVAEAAKGG